MYRYCIPLFLISQRVFPILKVLTFNVLFFPQKKSGKELRVNENQPFVVHTNH